VVRAWLEVRIERSVVKIAVMHVEVWRIIETTIGTIRARIEAVVVMVIRSMIVTEMVMRWTCKLRSSMRRWAVVELLMRAVRE